MDKTQIKVWTHVEKLMKGNIASENHIQLEYLESRPPWLREMAVALRKLKIHKCLMEMEMLNVMEDIALNIMHKLCH